MAHTDEEQRPFKKAKVAAAPLKPALKRPKVVPASSSAKSFRTKTTIPGLSPSLSKPQSASKSSAGRSKTSQRAHTPPSTKPKVKVDKGKAKAVPAPAPKVYPSTFKLVAGSYEKLLYGLEGSFFVEGDTVLKKPTLKPIFIFPAHVACVKAVAASPDGGKWLATGSTDEIIKVWDLRRRKEIGGLVQHEGSITHLSFPTRSHLMSASEDGTLCIFRARDWILLRTMKGHKGRVNSVAVHPSGKVGLSVGKDRTLRMWDLMRGKGCASTKLGKEGELVRWSTNGDLFVVQAGSTIDVYSTEMALLHTFTHPKRIQDIRFHQAASGKEFLLVAAEDKKVTIYCSSGADSTSLPIVAEAIGHQNRVKAIDTLAVATSHSGSVRSWTTIMSTVSSDGWMRVFDLGILDSVDSIDGGKNIKTLEAIAEYDTKGSRLTCCTLADGEASVDCVTGKREHEEDGESEEEVEELGEGKDGEENVDSAPVENGGQGEKTNVE